MLLEDELRMLLLRLALALILEDEAVPPTAIPPPPTPPELPLPCGFVMLVLLLRCGCRLRFAAGTGTDVCLVISVIALEWVPSIASELATFLPLTTSVPVPVRTSVAAAVMGLLLRLLFDATSCG